MKLEEYLLTRDQAVREHKDRLKELVKSGNYATLSKSQTVLYLPPTLIANPGLDLVSDMWSFQGFVFRHPSGLVVVDPGVEFYKRFLDAGLNPLDITDIIVSHNHTDHVADLVIFLEKIMRLKGVTIFLGEDTWTDRVPEYYRSKLESSQHKVVLLKRTDSDQIQAHTCSAGPIEFVELHHSIAPTFGFRTSLFAYVSDTGFDSTASAHAHIKDFYQNSKTVVVNLNDLKINRHSPTHMSGEDALHFLKGTNIKRLILQHIPLVNAMGEDSTQLYKLYFEAHGYEVDLPHVYGRQIPLE